MGEADKRRAGDSGEDDGAPVSALPNLFEVPVVQFLLPNGRRRDTSTHLPTSCRPLFEDMVSHGCHFEAEILTTGIVSVTISNPKKEQDLDCSLTENGPGVQSGMVAMLERGLWKRKRKCDCI